MDKLIILLLCQFCIVHLSILKNHATNNRNCSCGGPTSFFHPPLLGGEMTGTSSSRSVLLYSIFFRRVCRVISIPQNASGDLSSSRKMSACFQSICQRANAISEKLFYNASTLSQSLSCERAEKKKMVGSTFMSALFIKSHLALLCAHLWWFHWQKLDFVLEVIFFTIHQRLVYNAVHCAPHVKNGAVYCTVHVTKNNDIVGDVLFWQ